MFLFLLLPISRLATPQRRVSLVASDRVQKLPGEGASESIDGILLISTAILV